MSKQAFRFSPSPTGKLHLGSARTAMISFIMAKKIGAEFHLRIEDTDQARSTKAFEDEILASLGWLGATTDHAIVRQSNNEASGVYKSIADKLIEAGVAYYCQCSIQDLKKLKGMQLAQKKPLGYEGNCRAHGNTSGVLRLDIGAVRMFLEPNEYGGGKDINFTDNVYGDRHVDIRDLRDIVLIRSNGTATYLLANTIDDTISGINNIVRGADILPQTAIQILLRKVITKVLHLPQEQPNYTHVPLVLGESGEKLSKRSPTTKSIMDLKDEGILPTALIQFIIGVGNNSIPRDEALTLEQLIDVYDETQNAKNNVAFSHHQLLHINKLHIRMLTPSDIMGEFPHKLIDVCKFRASTIKELQEDLEHSKFILESFDEELQTLKDNEFCPNACEEFRDKHLKGKSSMSLEVLEGIR